MEYRAEKSTDTNALSCIVKQGDVFVVKSVIFTFVELLHRRAQCSKFFKKKKKTSKKKYPLQEFAKIPCETVKINPQGFSTIYVSTG